jgi:hypothetical protein
MIGRGEGKYVGFAVAVKIRNERGRIVKVVTVVKVPSPFPNKNRSGRVDGVQLSVQIEVPNYRRSTRVCRCLEEADLTLREGRDSCDQGKSGDYSNGASYHRQPSLHGALLNGLNYQGPRPHRDEAGAEVTLILTHRPKLSCEIT